jgi:hypothetical protein
MKNQARIIQLLNRLENMLKKKWKKQEQIKIMTL